MDSHRDDEDRIRLYLLARIPEAESSDIELVALQSPAALERIEAIEGDLILDFVHNRLAQEQRVWFLEAYSASPARWRRVVEAQALVDAARRRKPVRPERRVSFFQFRLALAACLTLAVVAGLWFRQSRTPVPPAPVAVAVVARIRLEPGLSRGAEARRTPAVLRIPTQAGIVRIELSGAPVAGREALTVDLRRVESSAAEWSGPAGASVDVPSRVFKPGDYVLGLSAGGRPVASYQFRAE
jgi:hypothetical protein